MQNTLLKEYVQLDAKFKILEERKQQLRDLIVRQFKEEKIDKVETDIGSFTIGQRSSWKYTAKVIALEDKVKIAKTKEQEKGIAKKSITEYLLYTAPKEN